MSPSRSKNGYGRDELIDGVESMVALRRTSLAILPPQLRIRQYPRVSISIGCTYVNFTPHRFEVRNITASIIADDMSKPAELAGKLYRNRGIYCCKFQDRAIGAFPQATHRRCIADIDIVLNDLIVVCI